MSSSCLRFREILLLDPDAGSVVVGDAVDGAGVSLFPDNFAACSLNKSRLYLYSSDTSFLSGSSAFGLASKSCIDSRIASSVIAGLYDPPGGICNTSKQIFPSENRNA